MICLILLILYIDIFKIDLMFIFQTDFTRLYYGTFEETYEMAKEAMKLFLEDYVKEMFKNAPKPSELKSISLKENDCIALIELDVKQYLRTFDTKAVKKTLTIPAWLNDIALAKNVNFSKVLQDALIEKLELR